MFAGKQESKNQGGKKPCSNLLNVIIVFQHDAARLLFFSAILGHLLLQSRQTGHDTKFEHHLLKFPQTDMMSYTTSTLNACGRLLDARWRPLRQEVKQEVLREFGSKHQSQARWAGDGCVNVGLPAGSGRKK